MVEEFKKFCYSYTVVKKNNLCKFCCFIIRDSIQADHSQCSVEKETTNVLQPPLSLQGEEGLILKRF